MMILTENMEQEVVVQKKIIMEASTEEGVLVPKREDTVGIMEEDIAQARVDTARIKEQDTAPTRDVIAGVLTTEVMKAQLGKVEMIKMK